jgi:hypothetical protein
MRQAVKQLSRSHGTQATHLLSDDPAQGVQETSSVDLNRDSAPVAPLSSLLLRLLQLYHLPHENRQHPCSVPSPVPWEGARAHWQKKKVSLSIERRYVMVKV